MTITEIIRDIEEKGKKYDLQEDKCLKIFSNNLLQSDVQTDVFLSARAFTSLLNIIVNNKISYICILMAKHSELLDFLNTFDDKYLSNAASLISQSLIGEVALMDNLYCDIQNIYNFLEGFLLQLKKGEANG